MPYVQAPLAITQIPHVDIVVYFAWNLCTTCS
jgi:hypothetical protein